MQMVTKSNFEVQSTTEDKGEGGRLQEGQNDREISEMAATEIQT